MLMLYSLPESMPRPRRRPTQARSIATYEAIVEAAARVLVRDGPALLNTNRVAKVAGVSIGTLYQYFPDKNAVVAALAEREVARVDAALEALLAATIDLPFDEFCEVAVRGLFAMRQQNRLIVLLHDQQVPSIGIERHLTDIAERQRATIRRALERRRDQLPSTDIDLASFVIVHAFMGVLHALDRRLEPPFVTEEELVQHLTRLSRAYMLFEEPAERG